MNESAQNWISSLNLLPHPEGGYYRETYRSGVSVTVCSADDHNDVKTADRAIRSISTAIYFLLEGDQISTLHRIRSDEAWHFYAGSSLSVEGILPDGERQTWRLGLDLASGERPQCVVPAGTWFGAHLKHSSTYALVGCTVSPGFDFADFELAERAELIAMHPQHTDIIERLTHP